MKPVLLTPEGKLFLEAARGILQGMDDSVTKVRALARGEFDELQVGSLPPLDMQSQFVHILLPNRGGVLRSNICSIRIKPREKNRSVVRRSIQLS